MEFIVYVKFDFVIIDGCGGVIGVSLKLFKDVILILIIFVFYCVRKYIDIYGLDIDLVIIGGFCIFIDFVKVIVMGVDVVVIVSFVFMVVVC